MITDDRHCIDVLTQISAGDTALQAVAFKTLDDHVNHCVKGALASGMKRSPLRRLVSYWRRSTASLALARASSSTRDSFFPIDGGRRPQGFIRRLGRAVARHESPTVMHVRSRSTWPVVLRGRARRAGADTPGGTLIAYYECRRVPLC